MSIDFFKGKHGYEIDGFWLPRVTAITSFFSKSSFFGSQKNADWGSMIHTSIEKMLKGESHQVSNVALPSLLAFAKWKDDFKAEIDESSIEKRVLDKENGYAGTIDLVAKVGGVAGVVDIKTSRVIWEEYALQTAAYLNAYNKESKSNLETRWILRIDQYKECVGCLAEKREKDGKERVSGGKASCNHQWGEVKGEVEFKKMDNLEEDLNAFFAAKEVWEWYHRYWLRQIPNYQKKTLQKILI